MTSDLKMIIEIVDGKPSPNSGKVYIGQCPQFECDGVLIYQHSAQDFVFDDGVRDKIVDMGNGSKHLYTCFKCDKPVFTNQIIQNTEMVN